jgi:hypothetical protein
MHPSGNDLEAQLPGHFKTAGDQTHSSSQSATQKSRKEKRRSKVIVATISLSAITIEATVVATVTTVFPHKARQIAKVGAFADALLVVGMLLFAMRVSIRERCRFWDNFYRHGEATR